MPDTDVDRKITWTMPVDPLDDTGLGGGIAFATSPNFCAELIDNFREDDGSFGLIKFVTCEDINDALNRAMATWSANHPYIDFYNVTDECVAEGNGKACSVAELYIDSMRPAKGSEDVAAFVLHNPKGFGRDYSHDTTASNWHTGVRTPSGEMVDDWVIQFATLTFHSHSCWYLDASFCSRFRDINERVNVTLLMQFVIWGCWCCSFVVLFGRLAQTCSYVFRDGVRRGVRRSVRVQAREITRTYLMLFLLITPPIIWHQIFIPCLTCYDFEATAVHELGHVLGFTHTDVYTESNRVAEQNYGANTCGARLSRPGNGAVRLDAGDSGINASVMFHLTTQRSRTCLSHNDLQGLLYSYPVCDADAILATTEPLCVKSQSNIGYVRFIFAIIPPFVCASIGVFCFAQLALYYESKARTHNRWQLGGLVAVQSAHARSEEAEAALSVIDQPLRSSFSVTAAAPERPRTPCLTAPRPMPMGTLRLSLTSLDRLRTPDEPTTPRPPAVPQRVSIAVARV